MAGSPLEQFGEICKAGLSTTSGNWSHIGMVPKGDGGYLKSLPFLCITTGGIGETVIRFNVFFSQIAGFELQKRCGNWVSAVVQAIKIELLPILLPKSKVGCLTILMLARAHQSFHLLGGGGDMSSIIIRHFLVLIR